MLHLDRMYKNHDCQLLIHNVTETIFRHPSPIQNHPPFDNVRYNRRARIGTSSSCLSVYLGAHFVFRYVIPIAFKCRLILQISTSNFGGILRREIPVFSSVKRFNRINCCFDNLSGRPLLGLSPITPDSSNFLMIRYIVGCGIHCCKK